MLWLLRGNVTPKTAGEVAALVARAPVALGHHARVIGIGDQTVDALPSYARDDRHGVFFDVAPGTVTVCAVEAAPASPAACQTVEVPKGMPANRAVIPLGG